MFNPIGQATYVFIHRLCHVKWFYSQNKGEKMSDREFDVVIFGASGYTGKLVAEYMHDQYGNDHSIKYAIAGRNIEKLLEVKRSGLNQDISILEVDSSNLDSLDKMTRSARCILTTVGPYQLYGSKLVESCARNGTDYVGSKQESPVVEMINAHKETAQNLEQELYFRAALTAFLLIWGSILCKTLRRRSLETSSTC